MPMPNLQEGNDAEILHHYINRIAWRQSMRQILTQENFRIQDVKDQLVSFVGYLGSTPPTNILQARRWATCHDMLAALYRPKLRRILNDSGHFSEGEIEELLPAGIEALLHSITAFHGIIGQLVLTNVCMTASVYVFFMSALFMLI